MSTENTQDPQSPALEEMKKAGITFEPAAGGEAISPAGGTGDADDPANPGGDKPKPGDATTTPAGDVAKPGDATIPPAGDKPEENNVSEDAIKKYLKDKLGLEVENLDDLKKVKKDLSPEETKKLNEKLREDALSFAITKGKFTASEFEAYSKESAKNPADVVFEVLKADWLKGEPELTEEELQERFRDHYKLDLPEDSWQRKAMNHELITRANQIFEAKHPKILGAVPEYMEHLQEMEDAGAYKSTLDRAIKSLPVEHSFELELPTAEGGLEKKNYTFSFSTEAIEAVKKELLQETSFQNLRGSNEATLTLTAKLALLEKEYSKMVTSIAKEHGAEVALRVKAGRKGIVPNDVGNSSKQTSDEPIVGSGPAAAVLKEAGYN